MSDEQKKGLTMIFTEILKASHNNQTNIFVFTFKFKKRSSKKFRLYIKK